MIITPMKTNQGRYTNMCKQDITEYERHLQTLRSEDSILKIENNSLAHASVLVSNLLDHATDEVLIYTSSLCKQFYARDKMENDFISLKSRGITPKILIQYKYEDGNPIGQDESIRVLKKIFGDSFQAVFLPRDNPYIEIDSERGKIRINNFTVVDEKAFRYEKYETEKDACIAGSGEYTKAVGCMNDIETAKLLKSAFLDHYYSEA